MLSEPSLLDHLRAGGLVLTSNQRIAQRLRSEWAEFHQASSISSKTGHIVSFDDWLNSQWQELLFSWQSRLADLMVLSDQQEQQLWLEIIKASEQGGTLLRPAGAAQLASSGLRDLQRWQLAINDAAIASQFAQNEDTTAMLEWASAFIATCEQRKFITKTQQQQFILTAFAEQHLSAIDRIVTVGFVERPPLFDALLNAACKELVDVNYAQQDATRQRTSFASTEEEIRAAASWALAVTEQNPKATVAVVIPDLAQRRRQVERLFREAASFDYVLPHRPNQVAPVNISSGEPLLNTPLVHDVMQFLQLITSDIETEALISWLQSPFFDLPPLDSQLLTQLISDIYAEKTTHIQFSQLRRIVFRLSEKVFPDNAVARALVDRLQGIITTLRSNSLKQDCLPSDWSLHFQTLLSQMGWMASGATQRIADSIEYQQLQHFLQALQQFGQYDAISGPVSITNALTQLHRQLAGTLFQPQSKPSSIHVLGLLEATGLRFSHLWLQGMHDQQWPPSVQPNPMLPIALQREKSMPRASEQRELRYASQVTEILLNSASHIVVSHAEADNDIELGCSSLLQHITSCDAFKALITHVGIDKKSYYQKLQNTHSLETLENSSAPTLSHDEVVRGGSVLFKNQSQCPFRAFVIHRLAAQSFEQPGLGIDARDHGAMLHRCLEFAWRKLGKLSVVKEIDETELTRLIDEAVEVAISDWQQTLKQDHPPLAIELQRQRLQELTQRWFELERQRGDFAIAALEQKHRLRFDALEVNVRIDRVDRLADGSLLVMDYKTGQCHRNQWEGLRPDDPQLPLYSVLLESDDKSQVAAIAFAKIKSDEVALISEGLGEFKAESGRRKSKQAEDLFPEDEALADWQKRKQQWRENIGLLAEEFINGHSIIEPKHPVQTCQYCELKSVCRFHYEGAK